MLTRLTLPILLLLLPLTAASSERSLGLIVQSVETRLTIIALTPNGPAQQAGLRRGDRLVAIGEQSLEGADGRTLDRYLQAHPERQTVELMIERDGRRQTIVVTPETLVPLSTDVGDPFLSNSGGRIPDLDGELMANHEGLQDYFGTSGGVVVLRAAADNAWSLRSGDVILSVGGRAVREPADISRIARQSAPGTLALEVLRSGGREELEISIGRDWPGLASGTCNKDDIPSTTPSSDFIVIEDGSIVRHQATGLEWQRCALGQEWDGETCEGAPEHFTWAQASEAVEAIGPGWRLPRINELQSIVEHCRNNPSINRQAFPNAPAKRFWSSTVSSEPQALVWTVWFSRAGVDDYHRASAIHVRAVRGEPDPDFVLPR